MCGRGGGHARGHVIRTARPDGQPAGGFEAILRVVDLTRITTDPQVMGRKPCIRGLRVTVGTIVGLVAAGRSKEEILRLYPYLEEPDIAEALTYAAWRAEEIEASLARSALHLRSLKPHPRRWREYLPRG